MYDGRLFWFFQCPNYSDLQRPCLGGPILAHLNFKTSRVGVYKCLSLIVGFAITVAIWPREVVSCRDFILGAVATFWAMSLVRIYPGRASEKINDNLWRQTKHFKVHMCLTSCLLLGSAQYFTSFTLF